MGTGKFNLMKVKLWFGGVSYVGWADGLKPDADKVRAISEMHRLTDIEGLRRILAQLPGQVHWTLGHSTRTNLTTYLERCNILCGRNSKMRPYINRRLSLLALQWKHTLKKAKGQFQVLIPVAEPLVQWSCKPVAFTLKTLAASEELHVNIERELLAIVWGAERCKSC